MAKISKWCFDNEKLSMQSIIFKRDSPLKTKKNYSLEYTCINVVNSRVEKGQDA